jgi:hypothetical protein
MKMSHEVVVVKEGSFSVLSGGPWTKTSQKMALELDPKVALP